MDGFDLWALAIAAALVIIYLLWRDRPRHGRSSDQAASGAMTLSKTLNIGATSTATVAYTDKAGNPVTLPAGNVPAWSVDQAGVASVTPAADGMTAAVDGLAVGTATVTVVAEGDPTPGVDTITLTGTVNVVDEAAGGTLTFS